MNTTEFITASFTLACTLGPLIGGTMALASILFGATDSAEVEVGGIRTGWRRTRRDESAHVAELKEQEKRR